jgi:hypothetical protein
LLLILATIEIVNGKFLMIIGIIFEKRLDLLLLPLKKGQIAPLKTSLCIIRYD